MAAHANISEICWLNGHAGRLVVLENELFTLYDVDYGSKRFPPYDPTTISTTTLTSAKPEHEYLRCFALDHSAENYLALGFNTGKINIMKVDVEPIVKPFRGEEVREVQKKSITSLAWNFNEQSKFSAAFERGRGVEHSVVVYDANRTFSSRNALQNTTFEANLSEKVSGMSWFNDEPSLLVVSVPRCLRLADVRERNGFNTNVGFQATLLGVATEPNLGYHIACHSKNTIFVMDRRFVTFPIHEVFVDDAHTISRLSWCATRPFHMSCVVRDASMLYDFVISPHAFDNTSLANVERNGATLESIKQTFEAMNNENKYTVLHNMVPGCSKLQSFDWHPTRQNELALLCLSKNSPKNVHVIRQQYDVTSAFSAEGELVFAAGGALSVADRVAPQLKESRGVGNFPPRFADLSAYFAEADTTAIMRQRIHNGYGYGNTSNALFTIIERSKNAIENDAHANEDVRFCWRWMEHMYQLSEVNEFLKIHSTRFPGIKHISGDMKSNSSIQMDDVTFRNRIFTNEKRDRILKICGWPPFEEHGACRAMLDEMMARRNIRSQIRAAMLALIFIQGPTCKQYLQDICKFTLSDAFKEAHDAEFVERYQKMVNSVTDILNTYNGIQIPKYEAVCREISDSYLLVMLKHLARREGYNTIQVEIVSIKDVELEDKLAFAAIHMDDDSLNAALEKLLDELEIEKRPLSGLLITGLDDQTDCHQLIHKYIDLTQDIQTASILLIVGNCFRKSKVLQDMSLLGTKVTDLLTRAFDVEPSINARRQSLHCVRDYMELMSMWSFWLQKTFLASFLRTKTLNDGEQKPKAVAAQAVIACNFCGVPIYPTTLEKIESLRQAFQTPSTLLSFPRRGDKSRVMSCSRCRKPLPKCTICRRHFGSQAEAVSNGNDVFPIVHSAIDHWFVWCCNCNHGGHLSHIREWFNEYAVCPASGCDCLCMDRDHQLRDELFVHSKGIGESLFSKNTTEDTSGRLMYKNTKNFL